MSSTTIISLRQQESSNVTTNGVWETTLDHPVILEEGDEVAIKSVYLDTVADVINLEADTPITMTAMLYITNGKADQNYPYENGKNWPGFANPALRVYLDASNANPPAFSSFGDPALPSGGGGPPINGDNHFWWMSQQHTTEVGATNWSIPQFTVIPTNKTSGTKTFGGITLQFRHRTLAPGSGYITTTKRIRNTIDRRYTEKNPYDLGVLCTGTADAPDFELTNIADLAGADIESVNWTQFQTRINGGVKSVTPVYKSISFTIPRGIYTPTEICGFITDRVTNLQYGGSIGLNSSGAAGGGGVAPAGTKWPSYNPWLTTVMQETQGFGDINSLVFVNADERYGTKTGNDVDVDGQSNGGELYFRYDVAQMAKEATVPRGPNLVSYPLDKWIGTNQFAMEFDEVQKKVKITTMHFPLYVNETDSSENGVPGIAFNVGGARGMQPAGGDASEQFQASGGIQVSYSGIAFTSLEPAGFWNSLGFGGVEVSPNFNKKMRIGGGTTGDPPVRLEGGNIGNAPLPAEKNSYTLKCDVGINTTGALVGTDLPVNHINKFSVTAAPSKDVPPTPTATLDFFGEYSVPKFIVDGPDTGSQSGALDKFVSTNEVTSIFSDTTINSGVADEGYFLVDISNNFKQNFVGGKEVTSKSTQSIVNRYYTNGSFTSDQGAGSVTYVHQGEPEILSSFNVAVRNPDYSFVDQSVLKPKNAIFVQVIKAQRKVAPQKKEASKEK